MDPVQSLESALRREQKKVALVQEVSRALSTVGDLDALLKLIIEKVTELMSADRATLYLVTEDGRQLWSKVMQGGTMVEIRLDVGEGVAGWVAQTREIVNIPDAYADQRFQPSVDLKSGYRTRSILSVPMTGALGGLVGVLQVLNKQDGPFVTADEELMGALAAQAAIAIENARLYHSLVTQNQELIEAHARAGHGAGSPLAAGAAGAAGAASRRQKGIASTKRIGCCTSVSPQLFSNSPARLKASRATRTPT